MTLVMVFILLQSINSQENKLVLRQRSPSISSVSSSSSSSFSSNREIEECNKEPNNIMISLNGKELYDHSLENKTKEKNVSIESVNDNMKDETAVESNLELENEVIEFINMNAGSEGKEERDFSSDDSITDPNYYTENNDLSSDLDETVKQNKEENISRESDKDITRRRKRQPELWKKNVAKRLRNAGKEYVGKNNKVIRERRLGPGCTEKCKLKCNTKFDDETRRHIFDAYYKLPDLQSKRTFVAFNMSPIVPTYQYKRGTRRNNNAFYMKDKDGEKIRVCKSFFMSTLDISGRFIRTVTEKSSDVSGIMMEDLRGKHNNHSRVDNNIKDSLRNFIKAIPNIESHYCQADSRKGYYINESKTIAEMYRDYVKQCEEKGEKSANYIMFNRVFNGEFNIFRRMFRRNKAIESASE